MCSCWLKRRSSTTSPPKRHNHARGVSCTGNTVGWCSHIIDTVCCRVYRASNPNPRNSIGRQGVLIDTSPTRITHGCYVPFAFLSKLCCPLRAAYQGGVSCILAVQRAVPSLGEVSHFLRLFTSCKGYSPATSFKPQALFMLATG